MGKVYDRIDNNSAIINKEKIKNILSKLLKIG
jgi:hypothetical protein